MGILTWRVAASASALLASAFVARESPLAAVHTHRVLVHAGMAGGMHGRNALAAAILRARGIRTRREFAEEIGVTEQTIYNWETGRSAPTLIRHAHALYRAGVPPDLITGDPNVRDALPPYPEPPPQSDL